MSVAIIITSIILLCPFLFRAYNNTKKINLKTIRIPENNREAEEISVLHLTDLHLENLSVTPEDLEKLVSGRKIDLIALTGDFLDRKRSISKLMPYLEMLRNLKPEYGIYTVFGNHDYVLRGKHFMHLKQVLEDNGCKTLQNEHVTLRVGGKTFNIIGIDDFSTKRSDIEKAYRKLPGGYNLILTHDPNIVLEMEHIPYDYLLSGHFHGGQIYWPKPYHLVKMGKLARMKIIKGLHYYHGKPFYISEGLGQTAVNIRIGSRPEITFHEIGL